MSIKKSNQKQPSANRNEKDNGVPDEELTKEAIFLQPWFLPIEIYRAIRRLLPYIHLFKMRYYFEDYGCLKCGKKNVMYQSNGLCESCGVVIRYRVKQALMRRLKKAGVKANGSEHSVPAIDGMLLAEQILSRRMGDKTNRTQVSSARYST